MGKGKMPPKVILESVRTMINQAQITGEKLNGTSIARRVGCGRTVLYTNMEIRELLLEAGIIDESSLIPKKKINYPIKEFSATEKKLQKAEQKASRLELLLTEANEKILILEKENESLKFKNRLLSEGKTLI